MTDKETRLFDLIERYGEIFGEGNGYPMEQAPPLSSDELITLYERCLREGKPWEDFVSWRSAPDVIY